MEKTLKQGRVNSCGCLIKEKNRERTFTGYEDISGQAWGRIKYKAQKRNIEFNINIEYAWNLYIKQNKKCILSNIDIVFAKTEKEFNDRITTASLDRINSIKGYIEGNVQWLHKHVNIMKLNHNQDYFTDLCKQIANHQGQL